MANPKKKAPTPPRYPLRQDELRSKTVTLTLGHAMALLWVAETWMGGADACGAPTTVNEREALKELQAGVRKHARRTARKGRA